MTIEFKLDARWAGETEDTPRIQRQIAKADKQARATGCRPVVILAPEKLLIKTPLRMSDLVTCFRGEGAVLVGMGGEGLVWDKFWRGKIDNLRFEGPWKTCLRVPTLNCDGAHQVFEDLEFGPECQVGIDQLSYDMARSTVTVVKDCRFQSQVAAKIYADVSSFVGCDFRYTGGDYPLILDSQASIRDCMFTPYTASTPYSAWIKLISSEQSRGLLVDSCRFGSECGGGMPVVESWAEGNFKFESDYGYQTSIVIRDSAASPAIAPQGRRSIVVLNRLPNAVVLERVGSSTPHDGFVTTGRKWEFPQTTEDLKRFASIRIDPETMRSQARMNPPKVVGVGLEGYLV
jgi:hypothetical protein